MKVVVLYFFKLPIFIFQIKRVKLIFGQKGSKQIALKVSSS